MRRLTQTNIGEEVILVDIVGGRGVRSKFFNMGLVPGLKITVISKNSGPIVLKVRDFRLALGRGMAEKIMVE
jgi:ferrous iron transport protein A